MTEILHCSFKQDAIIKHQLQFSDLFFLEWLKGFASYIKVKSIKIDDETYFWIKYSKVLEDLPLLFPNIYSLRRTLSRIASQKNQNRNTPLILKLVRSMNNGTETYFAFNPIVMEELEGKKDMISLLTGHEIATKKIRDKDYQRIPVNPNILSIFKKLLKVQENGKQLFTNHELPTDEHHYTNLFGTFQDAMLALYEGRFLTKYSSEKMDEWFRNKYKYYLNPEKQKFAIRNCKNDWDEIKKLVINSANNYSKWFNIDTEQYNKSLLPRSIIDWIYNVHTKTSMFYVSLLIPPSSAREADADKIYNSIPSKIRKIFSPIYREEFDGFTFWNKIKNLTNWYDKYATKLCMKDTNCYYWLDIGTINFLENYKEWLLEFTDKPFLKNIGIDNNTFDLYIKTKKQEHGIEIDIPRSL